MMSDHQQPARIVAVTQLLLTVLDDLSDRAPASLSAAEDDLLACLSDSRSDLANICTRARSEMYQPALAVLAIGEV